MKPDDHLRKAMEIKSSIEKLYGDESHVVAIVELAFGMTQHLIACGLERKFGEHRDTHYGTPALLRKYKQDEIATLFEQLDTLRHGRWYGGKGDGEVMKKALKITKQIEEWVKE